MSNGWKSSDVHKITLKSDHFATLQNGPRKVQVKTIDILHNYTI